MSKPVESESEVILVEKYRVSIVKWVYMKNKKKKKNNKEKYKNYNY